MGHGRCRICQPCWFRCESTRKTVKPFLAEILVVKHAVLTSVISKRWRVREPHQEFIRHLYPECFIKMKMKKVDSPAGTRTRLNDSQICDAFRNQHETTLLAGLQPFSLVNQPLLQRRTH